MTTSERRPLTDVHGVVQLSMTESQDGRLVGEGEFGFCGRPTDNGRIYQKSLIEREIQRRQEAIESRGMYGHLDHPEHGQTKLEESSHIVTGLRVESSGRVVGQLEVIEGKRYGDELAALIRNNCRVGISSRGVGSVQKDGEGNVVVQEDYKLLAYDVVADPASDGAHPEFNENYERTESGVYAPEGGGEVVEAGFDGGSGHVAVPADIDDETDEADRRDESTTAKEYDMAGSDDIETVEDLRREHPELVDEITESTEDEVRDELADKYESRLEEEREELEDKFAAQMEQFRSEIRESKNADGDTADRLLERFREEVIPDLQRESADEELVERVDTLEGRCQSLRGQLSERDRVIEDLDVQIEREKMARLFAEHAERVPMEHRDAFERLVGGASDYDSVDDFKDRLGVVVEEFRNSDRYVDAHVDELIAVEERCEKLEADLAEADDILADAKAEIRELRAENKRLSEAVADRDDILDEANRRIDELEGLEEEVEELEGLLAEANDELKSRNAKMREWASTLEEARAEIEDKERRLEEAELTAYKRKKVIGSKNPNERMRKLQEAKSKEAVDSVIEELNNQARTRSSTQTRHGDSDPDTVLNEGTKEKIRNRVQDDGVNDDGQQDDGDQDGGSMPTRVEESGGPSMPSSGGSRDIPGLSPGDMQQAMQQA